MDDLGALFGDLVAFLGEQVSASSLRLGPVPTATILVVLLVLLSLVARPTTRWTVRDLGHLAGVRRAMALAAESGGAAAFSLGTAGIARAATAVDRIQTLAALPILAHVARAAARSGVPLRISSNDPVVVVMAASALADAHRATETVERVERSRADYLGEGRPAAAAAALSEAGAPAAAFVAGSMAEEALILLDGAAEGAAWTSFGTANPSQASSVLLEGEGTLVGSELFQAPSDLRPGHDRTAALAANRLIVAAVVVVLVGSAFALVGGIDLAGIVAGR